MTFTNVLHLPPGVFLLVVIMFWPAIWAAAGLMTALGGDIGRMVRRRRDFGPDAARHHPAKQALDSGRR